MLRPRQNKVRKNQPVRSPVRRRQTRKKTIWQKLMRWVMVMVLATLCIVGVWEFDRVESVAMSLTTVQHVTIVGLKELERKDVLAKLDLSPETSLFEVQLESIISHLKSHPWVRNAVVERVFPHTLAIRIDERVPAAIWQSENVRYLLDDHAHVLSVSKKDQFPGLPTLLGIPGDFAVAGDHEVQQKVRDGILIGRLLSSGLTAVPTIHVDQPSRIVADTQDLRFQFGDSIEAQWQRFQALYPSIETQITHEATEVDLRYPGKVILRKRE